MLLQSEVKEERNPFSDWPKSFYEERDVVKRFALVIEKIKRTEDMEEKLVEGKRLETLRFRYPILQKENLDKFVETKRGKPLQIKDNFMAAWMEILISGRTGISFWNKKKMQKWVSQQLDNFHLSEKKTGEERKREDIPLSDAAIVNLTLQNLDIPEIPEGQSLESTMLAFAKSPETLALEQMLLRLEWKTFAKFWMETCIKDKSYSSTVFGLVRMKDETLAKKLAQEIADVCVFIPRALGLEERAVPLRNAVVKAYEEMIYQGRSYWDALTAENKA